MTQTPPKTTLLERLKANPRLKEAKTPGGVVIVGGEALKRSRGGLGSGSLPPAVDQLAPSGKGVAAYPV